VQPGIQEQIRNQAALEEAALAAKRAAQEKMVAAAAMEKAARAQEHAKEAATQRRMAQDAHNRARGLPNY